MAALGHGNLVRNPDDTSASIELVRQSCFGLTSFPLLTANFENAEISSFQN